MKKETLEKAKKIEANIQKIENTKVRIGTLILGWEANGTVYYFSKTNLEGDAKLNEIFSEVTETARVLLFDKVGRYLKSKENELEKLQDEQTS